MWGVVLYLILGQAMLWTVPSTNAQRAIQQYLHLTGSPYTIQIPANTPNNYAVTANQMTLSNQVASQVPSQLNQMSTTNQVATQPSQPKPATALATLPGALSALTLPSLIAAMSATQQKEQQPPTEGLTSPPASSSIDGKLLNNLAIALQLLILSNILKPPPETTTEKAKEVISELTQNQYYPTQNNCNPTQNQIAPTQNQIAPTQNQIVPTQNQYNPPQNLFFPTQLEQVVPGANFVGTSGFAEPNLAQMAKPSRSGINLMSPYEALAKLSEPGNPFTVSSARRDFQSPYAMMDKDLFSMNDLF